MKNKINATIRFLKASIPIYDEILQVLETNGGWLNLQQEFIDKLSTTRIRWWELYKDEALFKKFITLSYFNEEQLKNIKENYTPEQILSEISELIENENTDALTDEEIAEYQALFESASKDEQQELLKSGALQLTAFLASFFNYLCIMVNGKNICRLVDDALHGDINAYCKAVQIDRTILFLPEFQKMVFNAQFGKEEEFLTKLSYRLKNPIISSKIRYRTLWLTFAILDDLGLLELPHEQLLDICEEVGVYGKPHGVEDVGHLTKRLNEFRKIHKNSKTF